MIYKQHKHIFRRVFLRFFLEILVFFVCESFSKIYIWAFRARSKAICYNPTDERLSNVLLELEPTDTTVLKNKLDLIKNGYDYIIIDTPPSLSITSINALVARDYAIISVDIILTV